jgi:hypothetical protein
MPCQSLRRASDGAAGVGGCFGSGSPYQRCQIETRCHGDGGCGARALGRPRHRGRCGRRKASTSGVWWTSLGREPPVSISSPIAWTSRPLPSKLPWISKTWREVEGEGTSRSVRLVARPSVTPRRRRCHPPTRSSGRCSATARWTRRVGGCVYRCCSRRARGGISPPIRSGPSRGTGENFRWCGPCGSSASRRARHRLTVC